MNVPSGTDAPQTWLLSRRPRQAAAQGDGVSLVIPAFNEHASIALVVERAAQVLRSCSPRFEIIVVDDGSSDHTASEALRAGARVLSHPYNRGYGNSLKTGILAARFENIVICDADQSYPLEQIPLLLQDADKYHMIVGARQGKHFHGSLFKRLGRWLQLGLVRFTVGVPIPDANSGFRLIKRSLALRYFDFVCSGFSFTTSITIALLCEQYLVKFVNVAYHKRAGRSHVRYVRDSLRSLQIIVHCILRYNPLKAFVLLALGALVPMLFFLILAFFRPWCLLGAGLFLALIFLLLGMGMLAYCLTSGGAPAAAVDQGLSIWADVPGDALPTVDEPAKQDRAA
jgi:glycosyltransferase involved in cell wall biosynthesis